MVSLNTIQAAVVGGLHLRLDGDRLVVGGLPTYEQLARAILAHKHAFVALLRAHPEFAGKDGIEALVERYEERAAILEFDAGVPRAEAERRAWAAIVNGEGRHG